MTALMKQIEATLRKNGTFEKEIRGSTLQKQMFEGFNDKEAEKRRILCVTAEGWRQCGASRLWQGFSWL